VIAEMLTCNAGVCSCDDHDHEADRRVPPHLRRKVLNRDNRKCRCCGTPHSLHVHHIIPWSEGGRTRMKNLITVCRNCHALIHAGLLTIVGDVKSCEFHAAEGRELHGPGEAPEQYLAQPPPFVQAPDPGPPPVRLQDVPDRVGVDWWRRHANLIRWSSSGGGCEFRAGRPLSKEEAAAAARSGEAGPEESGTVCQPRPARLDDFIGHEAVVQTLWTAVEAAKLKGDAARHMLLTGPPGLGKTTLARALAAQLGVRIHAATGSSLRTTEDLLRLLVDIGERDVVFVDEIHAAAPGVLTAVYGAMEDRQVNLVLKSGTLCRAVTLELPPFTLIAATTNPGSLDSPLIDRFVYRQRLEFYPPEDLALIIREAAAHLDVEVDSWAATRLASVSRGTPRRGIALLQQLCDEAAVEHRRVIEDQYVDRMLDRLGIDERGLDAVDRRLVGLLRSSDRPIGLHQAARTLGVDAEALEREHEPYLLHLGLIAITPQGRVAIEAAAA
jgi:Holliday junction DNA helicase RuvB